jgi:aconitate hydratase
MGVLPLQFPEGVNAESLELDGTEIYDLRRQRAKSAPRQPIALVIRRADGRSEEVPLVASHRHADRGRVLPARRILPYVLRQLLRSRGGPGRFLRYILSG